MSIAEEPSQVLAAQRAGTAVYFVVEPNHEQLVQITKLTGDGDLRSTVGDVFSLSDARTAFERSLDGDHRGKFVLRIRH